MTKLNIECVADRCPEEPTVTPGESTRCSLCGTRYDGTTVLSSPLPDVEAGDEGRPIGVVPEPDAPATPADADADADADATTADGAVDINVNLNVSDGS